MNELLQLQVKDEATGKLYKVLGFSCVGDDRTGWVMSDLVLYDENTRKQFRVSQPGEMKRLTLVK